jgi:Transposase DDE domain
VITEAGGLPLAVGTGPANQRDEQRVEELLNAIPPIPDGKGNVRDKPRRLLGDAGYGFWWTIATVLLLGIEPLLRKRGSAAHGSGLGKRRYVVERTLAWFAGFRRLRVCYERTPLHWQGLHELACCVICADRLHKFRHPHKPRRRKTRF